MTTTDKLPKDVQELYEIPVPLKGGPVFDVPTSGLRAICFEENIPEGSPRHTRVITPAIAARLIRYGFKGIVAKPAKTPTVEISAAIAEAKAEEIPPVIAEAKAEEPPTEDKAFRPRKP